MNPLEQLTRNGTCTYGTYRYQSNCGSETSVLDTDPVGSGFKLPSWIRNPEVKLSYKNPPFSQIFHDSLIFKNDTVLYQTKVLFNKIPYLLDWLKTKIKYLPTFWVENKNFSQNLVFA